MMPFAQPTSGRPESRHRRLAGLRRLWREQRGNAAVEFGLLGGLFILLFCFILEMGLTVLMQVALDNATRDASRLVKTHAITTQNAFAQALCGDLSALMACSAIQYNVVSGSSFGSLSTNVTKNSSNMMSSTQFSPGSSGQNVVVQVGYTRTILLPILNSFMGTNGTMLLVSTLAFQNEPY